MLYYGLIVIGTAAIVLALYNIVVIRLCSDSRRSQLSVPRPNSSSVIEPIIRNVQFVYRVLKREKRFGNCRDANTLSTRLVLTCGYTLTQTVRCVGRR
uniref:Uncharacterized protein n=1 Tax=Cannabis sativa TaxID=3483 RepID=A0A803NTX1_CANSA